MRNSRSLGDLAARGVCPELGCCVSWQEQRVGSGSSGHSGLAHTWSICRVWHREWFGGLGAVGCRSGPHSTGVSMQLLLPLPVARFLSFYAYIIYTRSTSPSGNAARTLCDESSPFGLAAFKSRCFFRWTHLQPGKLQAQSCSMSH